tara:strand:- start:226 stop:444 length:219 start_codon:yes stop_codon:yes gene_type:complete
LLQFAATKSVTFPEAAAKASFPGVSDVFAFPPTKYSLNEEKNPRVKPEKFGNSFSQVFSDPPGLLGRQGEFR